MEVESQIKEGQHSQKCCHFVPLPKCEQCGVVADEKRETIPVSHDPEVVAGHSNIELTGQT